MKTTFEYLSFPSGKHLIGDPFVRCVRALAYLATVDGHCHHPITASTAFVEGTHFSFGALIPPPGAQLVYRPHGRFVARSKCPEGRFGSTSFFPKLCDFFTC